MEPVHGWGLRGRRRRLARQALIIEIALRRRNILAPAPDYKKAR
jgi:hypothetical protein